jgi:hypothetical protein
MDRKTNKHEGHPSTSLRAGSGSRSLTCKISFIVPSDECRSKILSAERVWGAGGSLRCASQARAARAKNQTSSSTGLGRIRKTFQTMKLMPSVLKAENAGRIDTKR